MGTGDWCHPTSLKITHQLLKKKDGDKTKCPSRCKDKTFRYSSDTFNDSFIRGPILIHLRWRLCFRSAVLIWRISGMREFLEIQLQNIRSLMCFIFRWILLEKAGSHSEEVSDQHLAPRRCADVLKEGEVIMSARIEEILQLLTPLHCSKWWTARACDSLSVMGRPASRN